MTSYQLGQSIALAFFFFLLAVLAIIIYKTRKQKLTERENAMQDLLNTVLFENGPLPGNDGFIFCTMWRLSDIYKRAADLGYVLTLNDCIKIVGHLKKNFDKDIGINYLEIDLAIKHHVKRLTDETLRVETGK
jgi:hypothetical protein